MGKGAQQTNSDHVMPFGAHSGLRICDLPSNYLKWAYKNLTSCSRLLLEAMNREHMFRQVNGRASAGRQERDKWYENPIPADKSKQASQENKNPSPSTAPKPADPSALKDRIAKWIRQTRMEFHPDRSGWDSSEAFKHVNDSLRKLEDLIK